ncbi:MAG: DUF4003 family protein [Enhygromyxa sp.]
MPFRGHEGQPPGPADDPLARFFELELAFDSQRGFLADRVPLRLVAANLVLTPGDALEIAAQVRAIAEQIREQLSLLTDVVPAIRLLIAAVLLQRGDQPAAFFEEVERVREIMRKLGLRRREIFETVAILALRIRNELAPISEAQVERLRDIYEQMKRHHWLLTGPEDYPACAFLVGQRERSPEQIGERAHAIYEGLRKRARLWRGDPLQTASNMLALSPLEPDELVERFCVLAEAFDRAGVRIRQFEYDEVAVLCFLARPTARIVETVVSYRDAIHERLRWTDRATAFGLGANLAFVRLVGNDPELGALADAKTLLDMQTVIAARQAAAAAAAAGSA